MFDFTGIPVELVLGMGKAGDLGQSPYVRRFKRMLDLALAVALLPFVAPMVGLLWLCVRFDGGPGFFGHARLGESGRSFRCWKLRTMVVDSEAKLAEFLASNAEAAEEWARDRKLEEDPRITGIGHFLRSTSLDELPQIWNVLRGEMSFVGPRPIVREELARYGSYGWAYLKGRPGITGLWQVSGRNALSYDERVHLDVKYRSETTFRGDLRILMATAGEVLGASGR